MAAILGDRYRVQDTIPIPRRGPIYSSATRSWTSPNGSSTFLRISRRGRAGERTCTAWKKQLFVMPWEKTDLDSDHKTASCGQVDLVEWRGSRGREILRSTLWCWTV